MCSIAGSQNLEEVNQMVRLQRHRAPDGYAVKWDGKYAIAHGRLAIIDLSLKPLYEEPPYVLAFNGEIYNYIELRVELRKLGHIFTTTSDTEVLLKAYRQWGVKFLDKLNGMFALAIYDGHTIFLARDIAGEKPLYYTEKPFAFASENKALGFRGVELPPAHYGVYDFKKFRVKQWWTMKPRQIDLKTADQELEYLLADSVKLRTRSDVPYALYLSGGVDSTLLSTFHDFKHTFTYQDRNYKHEFLKGFPLILWHLDSPITSFSPFGLWKLAQTASKKVKVVISGEGADELFGGYIRYVSGQFDFDARKKFPSYKAMFSHPDSVNVVGWEEFNGNMRHLLRMGDRMAAAWGMENRSPFLDRRIIEFAFSLPDNLKISGLETKVILRRILARRFPRYREIEKAGLYCSVNRWLGVKDKFEKMFYVRYQNELWNQLVSSSLTGRKMNSVRK